NRREVLGECRGNWQRTIGSDSHIIDVIKGVVPEVGTRRPSCAARNSTAHAVVVVQGGQLGRAPQRVEAHALIPVLWLHPRAMPVAYVEEAAITDGGVVVLLLTQAQVTGPVEANRHRIEGRYDPDPGICAHPG